MRLFLVRHCEAGAPSNENPDPALNPLGLLQAERTAAELESRLKTPVETLWSSPTRMASQTAETIARVCRIPSIRLDDRLHGAATPERRGMEARGRQFVIRELGTMQALASDLAQTVLGESAQQDAVFITHGTTIAAYVCGMLHVDLDDYDRFRIDSGSITVLDLAENHAVLLSLNETRHLADIRLAPRGDSPPSPGR